MWLYCMVAAAAVFFVADIVLCCLIAKETKRSNPVKNEEVRKEKVAPKAVSADEEILAVNDRFDDKEEVKKAPEAEERPVEKKEEKAEEKTGPVVEEKKEEPTPVVEEKKEEPAPASVEEKKEEVKEEPEKEEKKPVRKKDDEKKPAQKKAEKKTSEKKEEKAEPKKQEKAPAKKAPVKEEVAAAAPAKEEAKAKVVGKLEICNSDLGGYTYLLRANNGQLLYESKTYKSTASCAEGAKSFIEAVKVGMFKVRVDKFNRYKFNLKSPTSSNIIYVGESFDNERSCLSNIESVRRFAEVSEIVDNTDADFKANFTPYTIPDDVKDKVENNNGVVGKWLIEQEGGEKNSPYVFLLYASNGQLLYESRDYSSYSSCKSGLETFRTAIREGQFIIDPDKAGRFKFILRNTNKNSLMEYIGQSYSTERACADGIDSIYRFALVSPTDKL